MVNLSRTGTQNLPCETWLEVKGARCGVTPTRGYQTGRCCIDHTPAALAGRKETVPDPARTIEGIRAAKGFGPPAPAPASGTQLADDRAIASGKRRSTPQQFREAKARLNR